MLEPPGGMLGHPSKKEGKEPPMQPATCDAADAERKSTAGPLGWQLHTGALRALWSGLLATYLAWPRMQKQTRSTDIGCTNGPIQRQTAGSAGVLSGPMPPARRATAPPQWHTPYQQLPPLPPGSDLNVFSPRNSLECADRGWKGIQESSWQADGHC